MREKLLWAVRNADGFFSVLLAGAVGVLGLTDSVSGGTLSNAIALTLAVLAFSLLRDRWRDDEQAAALEGQATALRGHTAALERVATLDGRLTDTHRTLEESSGVRIVVGSDIARALEEARADTERWYFKGSTGTYVRAVTLPHCVQAARTSRRKLDVRLEILDPTDLPLCEKYADLYRSLSADDGQGWTGDGTRRELYATILAACWHQHRYRLLDVRIGLSSAITTFRWDLSSSSLVITQQGPQFPGMVVRQGRSHYHCWSTELDQSLDQARQVPLERARNLPLSVRPTPEEIRGLFRAIDIGLPEEYTDEDLSELAEKAIDEPDPYARSAA